MTSEITIYLRETESMVLGCICSTGHFKQRKLSLKTWNNRWNSPTHSTTENSQFSEDF